MAILATIPTIGVCQGRPHHTTSMARRTIERLSAALAVTLTIVATLATPALAQNRTKADQDGTMRWDDGAFRAGDAMRLEPHIRFQTDMLLRDQSESIDSARDTPDDDRIDWPRRRIGLDGVLFKRVEFQ